MNVIHLLPNTVADQIAAGEVIQRPASVVKELMENAIDAGATMVKVIVQDAGRTQIQVIDDGCGMTETDARLAFERHATSKISSVQDLDTLATMGFRGEALASIAAVAQVELLTRRADAELGIKISIAASEVESQEPCATPKGSRFCVKNLFFNVPARRRFLKSDTAEMRHIVSEFLRVVLAHPSVGASLTSNGNLLYNLPAGNIKQRVQGVSGTTMARNLLSIESDTSMVKISGFIGTPDTAKKTCGDQYFFANNRYMRSPYFSKAVSDAYKGIITADHIPAFYIYFDVDPHCIDVNVHPQKTEIKFEDDQAIWRILNATVSACLNKNNILPSIDFDSGERIDIPTFDPNAIGHEIYNPFTRECEQADIYAGSAYRGRGGTHIPKEQNIEGWTNIYSALDTHDGNTPRMPAFFESSLNGIPQSEASDGSGTIDSAMNGETGIMRHSGFFMQLRNRYILTATRQGLLLMDQHRAHERIIYNNLHRMAEETAIESQRLLFPESMAIGAEDACILSELTDELHIAGIDITLDMGKGMIEITSIPAMMDIKAVRELLETIAYDCRMGEADILGSISEYIMCRLAHHGAMPYGRQLGVDEMRSLFEQLMQTADNARTPTGFPIFRILSDCDIDSLFKN